MTRREWIAATWAEWAPSYRSGRLDIGQFVIVSRKELSRWSWEHHASGANMQREDPAHADRIAPLAERESQQAEPVAVVRHLHAVRA
ncbi:hypothetical protein [Nocardioides zhouii]|uniref:Uncharacterized protein n=1 Tax=Nocardioides zhouii TaxID=1168729 RepID=A0A4V1RQZ3_9ACTN|nr:hypothetical protein [Nocardioides zhouii]RYC14557.1 hypothetical protein EUA94_00050 [Nocardioides zhouii]